MICIQCDSKEFKTKKSKIAQEVRGIMIDVFAETEVCCKCGFRQLTDNQCDELFRKTKEIFAELSRIPQNNGGVFNN